MAVTLFCTAVAADEAEERRKAAEKIDVSYVTQHKFTGEKVTKIPKELKNVDLRGGVRIDVTDGFDFSKPGIIYGTNRNVAQLEYVDLGGEGCYKYNIGTQNLTSQAVYTKSFAPIKPNRNYLISLLLWSDFSRLNSSGSTCEGLVWVTAGNADNTGGVQFRKGIPDYTKGWQRFEFVASPGLMESAVSGRFGFSTWQFNNGMPEGNIYIADFAVVELPPVTDVKPYAEGEGVTFRGGSGNLDMKVEDAQEDDGKITVTTTGTRYTFDKTNSTITAEQRINKERVVSVWESSADFTALSIKSRTERECVITSPEISFGVQLDGMVFLTPHKGDVTLKCTSKIAGIWNKLSFGFLTAFDDYGGFCVTPDLRAGTGKLCNYKVLTENLDFAAVGFDNYLGFRDNKEIEFLNSISNAKAGWQIEWTMSPGERLAISTFPPREYDWETSFEATYRNMDWNSALNGYVDDYQNYYIRGINVFSVSDIGYGMEWQGHFTQNVRGEAFKAHIKAAKEAGMKVITYAPAYFYYNKESADEWITEITRLRDLYGLDGIYSDGIPSESQWVTGYEESRMLRELFPDGFLVAHQTGNAANGGGPLSSAGHFIPAVDTYWTATLKGETIGALGFDSAVATITWPQYNIANCVGIPKGDNWKYIDEKGNIVKIPQDAQDLYLLEFNGRARITLHDDAFKANYVGALRLLKQVWKTHGNEPDFYEKYYAPAVRAYNRKFLEKYGAVSVLDEKFSDVDVLKKYGVYNTNAEIVKTDEVNKLKISGIKDYKTGSVLKRIQTVSGPMSIGYSFEVKERGEFEQILSDNYDNPSIGIAFSEDGKIKLRNVSGNYVNIGTYKRNTKYDIRFDIDTDTHTYDLYINGVRVIGKMKFADNVYGISEIEFTDGGFGSVCFVSDLKVIDKF